MQQESNVVWQWLRFNVPTLLAIGGVVWYMASSDGEQKQVNVRMDGRFDAIDQRIAALDAKTEPVANLNYRMGVVENQVAETNRRLDRFAENIMSSIELVRRDINGLSTRVEVMTEKIEIMNNGGRKETMLHGPRVR